MAVDILMSTYNGECYIQNQLYSLLMQQYKDWTLYIRDDGSSDNTLAIIEQFCQLDNRIKLVETGTNLGYGKSFISLLNYVTADYVAFCDQDDIWFEGKLAQSVEKNQQLENKGKPILLCGQGHTYSDEQGAITKGVISKYRAHNLQEFLFLNGGYEGCLFLFNKELALMAKDYKADYYNHDNMLCLLAHTFGEVVHFFKKPLMLHRYHHNTSGEKISGISAHLRCFFRKNAAVIDQNSYNQQKAFYDLYYSQLGTQQRQLFEAFFSFPALSKWQRIQLILKYRFRLGRYRLALLVKTILRSPIM